MPVSYTHLDVYKRQTGCYFESAVSYDTASDLFRCQHAGTGRENTEADGNPGGTSALCESSAVSYTHLDVDKRQAIDRASFIKNDGVSVIKFSLSEQECVLSSKSVEVGSSTEVLSSASFTGNSLEISCNGRYVFDAIKALSGSLVIFRLCGEMKPFIIKSVDDDNVLQLVLPVRTYA